MTTHGSTTPPLPPTTRCQRPRDRRPGNQKPPGAWGPTYTQGTQSATAIRPPSPTTTTPTPTPALTRIHTQAKHQKRRTPTTRTLPPRKRKKKNKQKERGRGKAEEETAEGAEGKHAGPDTRAHPPPAIPTPHVPHPPWNCQAQDHPPRSAATDPHEEPPRTTHDTPPSTTRTTSTAGPTPQPNRPPTAARQHIVVPPWMRYTPKPPLSQPTRGNYGTHQRDTAEDPPTVRPRNPLPAGSLPRTHPTPEPIAPPPTIETNTPATHRHSPRTSAAPGPQHPRDAATHRPLDPTNVAARACLIHSASHATGHTQRWADTPKHHATTSPWLRHSNSTHPARGDPRPHTTTTLHGPRTEKCQRDDRESARGCPTPPRDRKHDLQHPYAPKYAIFHENLPKMALSLSNIDFLALYKQLKDPPPILRVLDAKNQVVVTQRSRKHIL